MARQGEQKNGDLALPGHRGTLGMGGGLDCRGSGRQWHGTSRRRILLSRHRPRDHGPAGCVWRTLVWSDRSVRNPDRQGAGGDRPARAAERRDRGPGQGAAERRRPRRIHLRRAHSQAGGHEQGQPRHVVRGQQPRKPSDVQLFQRGRRRLRGRQRRQRLPDEPRIHDRLERLAERRGTREFPAALRTAADRHGERSGDRRHGSRRMDT